MDLLVIDPIDSEVLRWLASRHRLRFSPELAFAPRELRRALYNVRAAIVPSSVGIDAETLDYTFTVDDPIVYSRPWTVSTPMAKIDGPIFEYACHEGNYAMPNLLSAARSEEGRPADQK